MSTSFRSKKIRTNKQPILPFVQQDTYNTQNIIRLQVVLIVLFFVFGTISFSLYIQHRLNYLIYGSLSILFLIKTFYIYKFVLKQKRF